MAPGEEVGRGAVPAELCVLSKRTDMPLLLGFACGLHLFSLNQCIHNLLIFLQSSLYGKLQLAFPATVKLQRKMNQRRRNESEMLPDCFCSKISFGAAVILSGGSREPSDISNSSLIFQ